MKYIKVLSLMVLLGGCVAAPFTYNDIGAQYIGTPYILDPLGEGALPDADPLIRTDAFDCTTFVETALAGGDINKLNKIRYRDGIISFTNRNHFIESDWLPNNADIVENISYKFGKTSVRNVVIDKKNWFKTVHNIDTDFAPVSVSLEYLAYNDFDKIITDEPLIVLFITGNCKKCDKIGTDIAVVHMGFLMPNGMLRHASSSHKRVIDTDFMEYVQLRKNMQNNIGIMLVKIK